MLYEKLSSKSMAEIDLALRAEAGRRRFGVLHVHDLQQAMRNKDVEYGAQCCVFELCNPVMAQRVLEANASLASMLPCRISVFGVPDGLMISTILPTALLTIFGDPELESVAEEVEIALKAMIDEAA
jgi:uncharacterized protein (DUF302 family)